MGVLDSAISAFTGSNDAATKAQQTDPLAKALVTEQAKTTAANAVAADTITKNLTQRAAIMATPPAPHPKLPTMADLPKPPEIERSDPSKVFGQFVPLLASLGSALTKNGSVMALNAGTAAMEASKANDEQRYNDSRKIWQDSTAWTLAQNQKEMDGYRAVVEDNKLTAQEKMAQLEALAAQNQDALQLAAIRAGNTNGIMQLIEMRQKTANEIRDIYEKSLEADVKRATLAETARHNRADEGNAAARLAKEKDPTMAGVVGKIMAKKAAGLPVTPQEESAVAMYKDVNASTNPLAALMGGGTTAAAAGGAVTGKPQAAGSSRGNPVPVQTPAEAAALGKGAWVRTPDGSIRQVK